jgi:NAD(P)-dependent dehydrogenase (short-subunit alcohol dehydrogenase family)
MAAREFEGMVAVVTGGANGIGAACADLLEDRGAHVAVLDRDLAAVGSRPSWACDVTDDVQVRAAIDEVATRFGRLDIVVNNAGIGSVGDVASGDDAEWARVLDVNVTGIARVSRAALPYLRQSPSACIVNMCSAVAFVGVRQRALYSASKGAVLGLTLAMAADHVAEGIRVNAVAPGTTETSWVERLLGAAEDPEAAREALRVRQPLGRLVSASEVAHAVASIASPLAGSTTGAVLRVDGGMTSLRIG